MSVGRPRGLGLLAADLLAKQFRNLEGVPHEIHIAVAVPRAGIRHAEGAHAVGPRIVHVNHGGAGIRSRVKAGHDDRVKAALDRADRVLAEAASYPEWAKLVQKVGESGDRVVHRRLRHHADRVERGAVLHRDAGAARHVLRVIADQLPDAIWRDAGLTRPGEDHRDGGRPARRRGKLPDERDMVAHDAGPLE